MGSRLHPQVKGPDTTARNFLISCVQSMEVCSQDGKRKTLPMGLSRTPSHIRQRPHQVRAAGGSGASHHFQQDPSRLCPELGPSRPSLHLQEVPTLLNWGLSNWLMLLRTNHNSFKTSLRVTHTEGQSHPQPPPGTASPPTHTFSCCAYLISAGCQHHQGRADTMSASTHHLIPVPSTQYKSVER